MDTYDVKKDLRDLYAPRAEGFHLVTVPEQMFLMVDGHGDPNLSPAYTEAVEALFALSYAARAIAKDELGRIHAVGPLEGLWSADDPAVFLTGDKSAWDWTMMICQPVWITLEIVERARQRAARRPRPGLERVRHEACAEGQSVQILHVGSYDSEGPVLSRLHREYLPEHGLTFDGPHHEVYLSDPRRTEPARLRTVLRQPVAPIELKPG